MRSGAGDWSRESGLYLLRVQLLQWLWLWQKLSDHHHIEVDSNLDAGKLRLVSNSHSGCGFKLFV